MSPWSTKSWMVAVVGLLTACAQPMYDGGPEGVGGSVTTPEGMPGGPSGGPGLPTICSPCETSGDCGGADDLCIINSVSGGTFCAGACVDEVDCPKGFLCIPIQGASANQCVPSSGSCETHPTEPNPSGAAGAGGGGEPAPVTGGSGGVAGSGGAPNPGGSGGTAGTGGQPSPGTGGSGGAAGSGGQLPGNPPDGINAMCFGVCFTGMYNECTCYNSDPCGWANDGYCDDTCAQLFPGAYFDDSNDCGGGYAGAGGSAGSGGTAGSGGSAGSGGTAGMGGTAGTGGTPNPGGSGGGSPAQCGGSCEQGYYDSCTCGGSDPCGWGSDGYCDDTCYSLFPTDNFDDSGDCGYWNGGSGGTGGTGGSGGAGGIGGSGGTGGIGGSPGSTTYAITAVNDNLDNNDANVVADGLTNLGYSEQVRDTNVSTSELQGYLAQNLTTLYHTGHGFEGSVVTSNGSINAQNVQINVQNTIFATCLTLTYAWESAFGPNAQTVMGYTKISFDGIDDNIAQSFVTRLGSGHSHAQAWYLANAGVSMVADRWAAYVRTGSGIVEYSARTGNTPMSAELGVQYTPINDTASVLVRSELLIDTRTFEQDYPPIAGAAAASTSTYGVGELQDMRADALDAAGAVAAVEAWWSANGGLPSDAVVDRVVPIQSRTPGSADQVIGYLVRHGRVWRGIPVRGNGAEHHLAAYVSAKGIVATSRRWPMLYTARPATFQARPLRVKQAVQFAAARLARLAKGRTVHVVEARPVLGLSNTSAGELLVPAIELRTAEGEGVVVSNLTGAVL
jgi:hypothetical protein